MVDQRGLAAASDQAELLDPGSTRFFDRVLDQRLVDDGEHLLGHRLGGRQEPGAEARDGQDGLAEGFAHVAAFRRLMVCFAARGRAGRVVAHRGVSRQVGRPTPAK